MPIPTLQGLQTALSGLIANQDAIDTTGHNITNANTPGYSRQTAVLRYQHPAAIPRCPPITGHGGQLGTGVNVETFTRIRNTYLDAQFRTQNATLRSRLQRSRRAPAGPVAPSTSPPPRASPASSRPSGAPGASSPTSPSSKGAKEGVVERRHPAHHDAAPALHAAATRSPAQATAAVHRDHRAHRRSAGRRQADRPAQPPDQARRTGPPDSPTISQTAAICCSTSSPHSPPSRSPRRPTAPTPSPSATPRSRSSKAPPSTGPKPSPPPPAGSSVRCWSSPAPAARSPPTRAALNEVAASLADSVNALHTSTPFFSGATAATIAVAVTPAEVQTSSDRRARRQRRRAGDRRACAAAAPTAPTPRSSRRWAPMCSTAQDNQSTAPGRSRRDRQPAPVGLRGVPGRRNDQPHQLPARLPGLGAHDDDDGRNAQHPHQPHRTGGAVGMSAAHHPRR